MIALLIQFDRIENKYEEYFNKKDSHKLKHYVIQKPDIKNPNLIYVDLDENALKNYPLPKEIENELRITFKVRENLKS
ncbi:MAG TPA: hypothetical protein VN704_02405 [Verrucomicrobiae bacterium]|nr:hypothetical protein [Verrucomicrobiae bacterium]